MKNDAFMDIKDVAEYFGVSVSTIRRRLKEHKEGEGSFPLPVFGLGNIARWRRSDIMDWCEIEPEVIQIETPAQRNRKLEATHKDLAELGVKVSTSKVLQEG